MTHVDVLLNAVRASHGAVLLSREADAIIVAANGAAGDLLGWDAADLEGKRYGEALSALQRGVDGGVDNGAVWVRMAECERALGQESEAVKSEDVARRKRVSDPRLRLKLER